MLTILRHLAGQSQCHTQPVKHRYNVGFKEHPENIVSIKHKSRNRRHHLKTWFITVSIFVQNALKLTYEHLQKFSWGNTPRPSLKGEGEGGRRTGGRGGDGKERREGSEGNCAVVNFP